jgi:AcrR family transcriptional regulator
MSRAATAAQDAPTTRDETRERLVAAAAEVFAEKGYEGAGVQEIARRAGLTTGAIYSRFSGKAELLAEAIRDEASPELDALFATTDPEGQAADLLRRAGAHLISRRPGRKEGLLLEAFVAARRDPELRASLRSHLQARSATFARLVDFAKKHGDIDPTLDTDAVVHFCQAVGLGFLLYEAVEADRPDPTAWTALIERLVESLGDDLRASGHKGDTDA